MSTPYKKTKAMNEPTSTGKPIDAALLTRFTNPLPSVAERKAAGKALREKVPHAQHAVYHPSPTRSDPVALLIEHSKTRLQNLVPIRNARMLASPFAFLRGSAAAMAADLAPTPVTGLNVQANGDMHLANFGWFASAERNLVFGINDFDETLAGPWEWDLKRLVASAVVSGRFMGADKVLCEEAARAVVGSYRQRMRQYAGMGNLDVWYARIDEADLRDVKSPEARKAARKIMDKAHQRGHAQVLEKMTELVDSQQRIIEDAPLIVRETHNAHGRPIGEALALTLSRYVSSLPEDRRTLFARYRVVDVARKVVGVGSVGTRCWVVLLQGNSEDDPLFLQYKEAGASVLAPYAKASKWACEGQRVVVGQRLIQGAPDIFLGWGIQKDLDGSHFYVRQLRDMKGGAEFEPDAGRGKLLPNYLKLCGWALALAHAKSGDASAIAGYLGKTEAMDEALARFAFAYADQTERDFDALTTAARAKRIPVAQGAD